MELETIYTPIWNNIGIGAKTTAPIPSSLLLSDLVVLLLSSWCSCYNNAPLHKVSFTVFVYHHGLYCICPMVCYENREIFFFCNYQCTQCTDNQHRIIERDLSLWFSFPLVSQQKVSLPLLSLIIRNARKKVVYGLYGEQKGRFATTMLK